MNTEKLIPIAKGIIKHVPGVKKILSKRTGGTSESRYCYSVWMRHLIHWNIFYDRIPENVVELGPGDSLGIGLASLLSGSKHLYSLDVIKYWDNKRNLKVFEELIVLFRSKANIPDNIEYPTINPKLDNCGFPSSILSDNLLNETLAENRLNAIRKEILDIDNPANLFIKYYIPWNSSDIIKPKSIDFNLMGVTQNWNGHWTFSDFEWKIVKGGKIFLINREPISKHIELLSKYGFNILINAPIKMENKLNRNQLSTKFKNLSEEDITTSGTYILSRKE